MTEYRAYTTDFDRVVDAADLSDVIGFYDPQVLENVWAALQASQLPMQVVAQARGAELSAKLIDQIAEDVRADTIVSFLVDHSGSMRGQPIQAVMSALECVHQSLAHADVATEILGFTTSAWQGGKSRQRWQSRQKWSWWRSHTAPGRLNDLLHIVYHSSLPGERDVRALGRKLLPMLRPDLLKENIDGEALLWATERLAGRPEPKKWLFVLSDGAPADDSTLFHNHSDYLVNHLLDVIDVVTEAGEVELIGVGLAYEVTGYYPQAEYIALPAETSEGLMDILERRLIGRSA